MKKRIGLLLFLLSIFFIIQIGETNGMEKNQITFSNLNSNHFVSFVKEKQIDSKISKICTNEFCDFVRGKSIEESFEIFKTKYESFLRQEKDEEIVRSTILKGFPITSVNVLD